MSTELKTADQWCKQLGIIIVDPDGWRYENGEADFCEKKITREEFDKKVALCTINAVDAVERSKK